jgi:hypothetical protein
VYSERSRIVARLTMLMIAYGATVRPKAPYPNKGIRSPSILQRATISQRVWRRMIGIFGML